MPIFFRCESPERADELFTSLVDRLRSSRTPHSSSRGKQAHSRGRSVGSYVPNGSDFESVKRSILYLVLEGKVLVMDNEGTVRSIGPGEGAIWNRENIEIIFDEEPTVFVTLSSNDYEISLEDFFGVDP